MAEATTMDGRIATMPRGGPERFLVIDLKRPHPLGAILLPPKAAPAAVAVMARPSTRHVIHDGPISVLRAYNRSALVALGEAADPQMQIEALPSSPRFGPLAMMFSRPVPTARRQPS